MKTKIIKLGDGCNLTVTLIDRQGMPIKLATLKSLALSLVKDTEQEVEFTANSNNTLSMELTYADNLTETGMYLIKVEGELSDGQSFGYTEQIIEVKDLQESTGTDFVTSIVLRDVRDIEEKDLPEVNYKGLGYEAFSPFKSYTSGQTVVFGDSLYKFTDDKTAGLWDATKVEPTSVAESAGNGPDISDLIPEAASADNQLADKAYVDTEVATKYTNPEGGIPESDLSADVQSQLNKHFKGWYKSLDELKAAHTATEGDSAYVKDASPATTWSIYVYDAIASSDNNWADSGTDADTSNVQTFETGEEVNETAIDNTGLVNPAEGSLALATDTMQLSAKLDGVTATETKATPTIVDNSKFENGAIASSTGEQIAKIDCTGMKMVRFYGMYVGSSSGSKNIGYAFYSSAETLDETTLIAFYNIDSTRTSGSYYKEYVVDVPANAVTFVTQYKRNDFTTLTTGFYCYLMSGDSVGDMLTDKYVKTASWSGKFVYYDLTVNAAPVLTNTSDTYIVTKIEGLRNGDMIFIRSRVGSSKPLGAKVKNGKVVALLTKVTTSPYEQTIIVDDTFDAIYVNDHSAYINRPVLTVTRTENKSDHVQDELTASETEYNILCLGNSLTQCTMGYVPWIIKSVTPHIKFNLYFTYDGGSSLADYLDWLNGDAPSNVTAFYKYNDGAQAWVSVSNGITPDNVLGAKKWDLVTIQQTVDYNEGSWSTRFKPYVQKIHNILYNKLGYNFKLGYIMTPVKASKNNLYDDMASNTEKMMTDTATEVLFPAGTALQNARTTFLDRFGAGTHLTGDGVHVAAGIGCLITAYANALTLLKFMGCEKSLIGNTEYPNDIYKYQHNVPLPTGSGNAVGLSRYNIWVAQQCAVMALKYPLQVTDMVAAGMAGEYGVKLTLTNCISSNLIKSANSGETWTTKLTAKDGATIGTVDVTMGGDAVAGAYDSETGIVTIENVSGDIVITES